MLIRKILRRAGSMCPAAAWVQRLSLGWACLLLGAALVLFLRALPLSPDTYELLRLARELMETASAVLLVGVIGAVLIEERQL